PFGTGAIGHAWNTSASPTQRNPIARFDRILYESFVRPAKFSANFFSVKLAWLTVMENRPVVTVEVSVRPSDAYSPFTWTSQNLVRLVAVVIVGAFFYDVYQSRPAGNAAESLLALFWSVMLMLCVVLALFGIPYLRMIQLFRSTPSFKKP